MWVNDSFSKMKRELSFSFVLSWIDLGHWLNDGVKFHSVWEEKQGQNKKSVYIALGFAQNVRLNDKEQIHILV